MTTFIGCGLLPSLVTTIGVLLVLRASRGTNHRLGTLDE